MVARAIIGAATSNVFVDEFNDYILNKKVQGEKHTFMAANEVGGELSDANFG